MVDLFPQEIPAHIAVIMDGNSRWAKVRGLDTLFGHQEGALRVKDISRYCSEIGIKFLSLFAFSTENWQRPASEVNALMDLLVSFLHDQLGEMNENNMKFLTSGRSKNFSKNVNETLEYTGKMTEKNTGLRLILCVDYGGRQEIVDAAGKNKETNNLNEEKFRNYLYLPDIPDVDLLIRTSGEQRISNFMLWQLSYSELYFTNALWPDFTREELEKAVKSYNYRQRRFGLRI